MKYFIITGASRGIGEAFTHQVMKEGNVIFCLSRTINKKIIQIADERRIVLNYLACDFNDLSQVEAKMNEILESIDKENIDEITLLNNAGTVAPIKPIAKCSHAELSSSYNINVVAPMVLTSLFIREYQTDNFKKSIVNISSGAANRAVYGWSAYCSSKAAIDSFTKTVGLEQSNQDYPVKIISFAPGVVDTDMQKNIRSTDEENFIEVTKFRELKSENSLLSPEYVVNQLTGLLEKDLKQGGIYHIDHL